MFKATFILLLFAHVLGDFYFQSKKLAIQKEKSIRKSLIHSLIYAITCFIVIIPVYNIWFVIAAIIMSTTHLVIDLAKYIVINHLCKDDNAKNKRAIYIIDQSLHLLFIFMASILVSMNCNSIETMPSINYTFKIIGLNKMQAISLLLLVLLIWKPTNITIKKVLLLYKPKDNENKSNKNAGAFIGLLERVVILLLLSINQYSAIGLVLTAKSIARYDKISKDKEFAEYYLLGTLLSTVIVIFSYMIIFQ